MNTNELRAERIRQGKTTHYMAACIGKSADTYSKKERGAVKFDPNEMTAIQNELQLSPEQFNVIFFDANLQFSKQCDSLPLIPVS